MENTNNLPNLPPRLMAIAGGIARLGRQGIVYDIGTDHALLPIYMLKSGLCAYVAASDVSERSLGRARANAESYGVSGSIAFYRGDGFAPLAGYKPGRAVILAGIGGKNLAGILGRGGGMARGASLLALQPMSSQELLRKWLFDNSYEIAYERLAREGGRVYSILFCYNADGGLPATTGRKPYSEIDAGPPVTAEHKPYSDIDAYLGVNVEYDAEEEYAHFLRFTRLKAMNRLGGLEMAGAPLSPSEEIEMGRLRAVVDEINRRIR